MNLAKYLEKKSESTCSCWTGKSWWKVFHNGTSRLAWYHFASCVPSACGFITGELIKMFFELQDYSISRGGCQNLVSSRTMCFKW